MLLLVPLDTEPPNVDSASWGVGYDKLTIDALPLDENMAKFAALQNRSPTLWTTRRSQICSDDRFGSAKGTNGLKLYIFWRMFRMTRWFVAAMLMAVSSFSMAAGTAITVYQDPNCGCCHGWAKHMRESGFDVTEIQTTDMGTVKRKLGVPQHLGSCHTAVVQSTGQIIEGHVPANAVNKMLATPSVRGVSAPGMPVNSPGMGQLDGNLVTVDFNGKPFSKD